MEVSIEGLVWLQSEQGIDGAILFLSSLNLKVWSFPSHNFSQPSTVRVFFLLVFLLSTSAEMLDLLSNIYFAADAWTGNIQNEMDASYVEQSSLTNLFTEQKVLGWAGLL